MAALVSSKLPHRCGVFVYVVIFFPPKAILLNSAEYYGNSGLDVDMSSCLVKRHLRELLMALQQQVFELAANQRQLLSAEQFWSLISWRVAAAACADVTPNYRSRHAETTLFQHFKACAIGVAVKLHRIVVFAFRLLLETSLGN